MKTTQTMIAALLAGISIIHCGGKENQSESLSQLLTSKSAFSMDSDNLEEITDGCGGIASESVMSPPHTAALGEPVPVAGSIDNSAEEVTVSFRPSTFSLRSGGSTILSGTWREIDRNTIEVTIEGERLTLDVVVQGDTIILSLPTAVSLDCSTSGEVAMPDDTQDADPSEGNTDFSGGIDTKGAL